MNKTILTKTAYLIFTLLIGLGCNSNQKQKKVFVLLKNMSNPFFLSISNGTKDSASTEYQIITKSGKREDDVYGQIDALNAIVSEIKEGKETDIAGVIITPTSSGNELIPYLVKLNNKKIPIVIVDTKIDSLLLAKNNLLNIPFVGSSNIEGGKQAGEIIRNNLKNEGEVLFLKGIEGQVSATHREIGFKTVLDSNKEIHILERIANWDRQEAFNIVASYISTGKKIDAIFAANDEMALGAYTAYKNSNFVGKYPIIVGFDAVDEAKKAVKDGKIFATIEQDSRRMGVESIKIIYRINHNSNIDRLIEIPTKVVQK